LVQGKPTHEDYDEETRTARIQFQTASEQVRKNQVDIETKMVFLRRGYSMLSDDEAQQLLSRPLYRACPSFYKQIGDTACFLHCHPCHPSLVKTLLKTLAWSGLLWKNLADWSELPTRVTQLSRRKVKAVRLSRRKVKAVRRVNLLPVLNVVPSGRISQVYERAHRIGGSLHYYWSDLASKDKAPIKSSREFLVIDGIKSVLEYSQNLEKNLRVC
jgi:hypothetical protein